MINPIREFVLGYRNICTQKAEDERQRKENDIRKEFQGRIQLREYQGHMYISVDGIPLIEATDLREDIIDVIQKIRNTIVQFKLT